MPNEIYPKPLWILFLFACSLGAQQPKAPVTCSGLEAKLSRWKDESNAYVGVNFTLHNTSKSDCADTFPDSWELVLDGKALPDSGMIFGEGLGPFDGYKILKAGKSFEFGKGLPIGRFPGTNSYKLFWRAKEFQSNAIEIVVIEVEEIEISGVAFTRMNASRAAGGLPHALLALLPFRIKEHSWLKSWSSE